MLIEDTLFGKIDKIEIAIERLKQFQPKDKPYWLAFSGGKDSIVILKLAEMSKIKFEPHMNNTTVDPPELMQFVRKEYSQIKIDYPPEGMFKLIEKKGLPSYNSKWCCSYLKERGGEGYTVITGIRWEESKRRKKRNLFEACFKNTKRRIEKGKGIFYVNPIIDWLEIEVWEFIKKYKLKYCSLYNEGFKRIGCVCCPIGGNQIKEAKRWPKIKEAYRKAAIRFYNKRAKIRKWEKYKSGEEMFNYWMLGKSKANPDQMVIFE